jgi:hypothetical protein
MVMVISRLRTEGGRDKGQTGFPRDRKVLRKDLSMVFSRGHLGRCFEGSAFIGGKSLSTKDNMTLLFLENGDMISMIKKKKETCSMVWKFCLPYA